MSMDTILTYMDIIKYLYFYIFLVINIWLVNSNLYSFSWFWFCYMYLVMYICLFTRLFELHTYLVSGKTSFQNLTIIKAVWSKFSFEKGLFSNCLPNCYFESSSVINIYSIEGLKIDIMYVILVQFWIKF